MAALGLGGCRCGSPKDHKNSTVTSLFWHSTSWVELGGVGMANDSLKELLLSAPSNDGLNAGDTFRLPRLVTTNEMSTIEAITGLMEAYSYVTKSF